MNDLATIGKADPDQFIAIIFDLAQLDIAAIASSNLATTLALKNSQTNLIDMRNRMYTVLKRNIDLVRMSGKFAFADNRHKYTQYTITCVRR